MKQERLSDLIRSYRSKHGMSQNEFADKAGVSHAYISILEREQDPHTGEITKPKMETYDKLARAMDMSRDKLIALVEGKVMFEDKVQFEYISIPLISHIPEIDTDLKKYILQEGAKYSISYELNKPLRTFAFLISENDMGVGVRTGDIAITWIDEDYEDGDYVAVRNKDGFIGVKRIFVIENNYFLYNGINEKPIKYNGECEELFKVLGRIVQIKRDFRKK